MIVSSKAINKKHRGKYMDLLCPNCNIKRWVRKDVMKKRKSDYCSKCKNILKKGLSSWNKGLTKQTDIRINYERPTTFKKGQHPSPNTEFGKRNSHYNWKGGISSLYNLIRNSSESKAWIKTVLTRDDKICKECFSLTKKLHVHHKKPFKDIFQEFLTQYSQFSPIEDIETLLRLAINYEPFWDINNGITVCSMCHQKIHPWLTI